MSDQHTLWGLDHAEGVPNISKLWGREQLEHHYYHCKNHCN